MSGVSGRPYRSSGATINDDERFTKLKPRCSACIPNEEQWLQSPSQLRVNRRNQLGSPFVRGSFTSGAIIAGHRSPVQEHYILTYRE